MVIGHLEVTHSFYKLLSQEYVHFTILREPVDRVISQYYFFCKMSQALPNEFPNMENITLENFVMSGMEIDNHQARRLSPIGRAFDFGKCTNELLESAKRSLTENFTFFGLSERFNETLIFLKRILAWNDIFYENRNVTENRPRREDVPSQVIDTIVRHNMIDIELYKYAVALFDERIKEQGVTFQEELKEFKAMNEDYQRLVRTLSG